MVAPVIHSVNKPNGLGVVAPSESLYIIVKLVPLIVTEALGKAEGLC